MPRFMVTPRGPRKRARTEESPSDDSSPEPCVLSGARMAKSEQLTPDIPVKVNWQAVLCKFLGVAHQADDSTILEGLREVTERLEAAHHSIQMASATDQAAEFTYQVIHRILCDEESTTELCSNEPWPVKNDSHGIHLRGSGVIDNMELYLERHKSVTFLVYRDYTCCESGGSHMRQQQPLTINADTVSSLQVSESVSIVSETFGHALDELWSLVDSNASHPKFDPFTEFDAPYVWWYNQRNQLQEVVEMLEPEYLQHIQVFQDYLSERFRQEYKTVDQQLAKGRITTKYLRYLYIPGEIQLSKVAGDDTQFHRAFKATSWLQNLGVLAARWRSGEDPPPDPVLMVEGTSWSYDGSFQQDDRQWSFSCKFPWSETFAISELDVFPLRFADPGVAEALRRRGGMFWDCRSPTYICYHNDSALRSQSPQDARYMIDYNTYKEMHPPKNQVPNRDDLGPEATKPDAPTPDDDFILCLPSRIPGYYMHKKEWIMLYVSRMAYIAAEKSTDLISGKGNGLFILLHGGPGTGKTLTAESITKIARRPLYQVTCGDIGTKAEDVERYLETVLLLDEADVFLMQRSIEDFKQNALVSIFLRVLENYDGIIILTSNRVELDEENRRQIWTNIIEHVKGLTTSQTATRGISFSEINDKIPELAKKTFNGREIRNAVSTARQLAMFENETMGYKHLETMISEMDKFNQYATDLKGGLKDSEIARHCQEY